MRRFFENSAGDYLQGKPEGKKLFQKVEILFQIEIFKEKKQDFLLMDDGFKEQGLQFFGKEIKLLLRDFHSGTIPEEMIDADISIAD